MLTVPNSGTADIADVTFCHFSPLSVVTCTRPSSLPAQISPSRLGDSAMAKTVPYVSTPVLSPVIGPPAHFCLDLSLRVRSGLIGRSEEHTSELQSQSNLVCRLLLEKKKIRISR